MNSFALIMPSPLSNLSATLAISNRDVGNSEMRTIMQLVGKIKDQPLTGGDNGIDECLSRYASRTRSIQASANHTIQDQKQSSFST